MKLNLMLLMKSGQKVHASLQNRTSSPRGPSEGYRTEPVGWEKAEVASGGEPGTGARLGVADGRWGSFPGLTDYNRTAKFL